MESKPTIFDVSTLTSSGAAVTESSQKEEVGADEDEPEPDLPINFHAVVLAKACRASAGVSLLWAVIGLLLVLAQVAMVLSVALSVAWTPCLRMDDCKFGFMCVQITDATTFTCEDCGFACLWRGRYEMPASALADAQIEAQNITQYCEQVLEDMPAQGLDYTEYRSDTCFYVEIEFQKMSTLARACLYLAVIFIVGACIQERMQQSCTQQIRHLRLPFMRPRQCHSAVRDTLLPLLLICTEMVAECVLLPLVPAAMILLIINTGLTADNILLGGLGVGFVLEVDDVLAHVMLSYSQRTTMTSTLLGIVADSSESRKRHINFELQRRLGLLHGLFALATFIILIAACRTAACEAIPWLLMSLSFVYGAFIPECVAAVIYVARVLSREAKFIHNLRASCQMLLACLLYYMIGAFLFVFFSALTFSIYYGYPASLLLEKTAYIWQMASWYFLDFGSADIMTSTSCEPWRPFANETGTYSYSYTGTGTYSYA